MTSRSGPNYRGGFTLIELLVVVTMIALLIGILVPAFGRARAMTKSTVCRSNLRQLGIALFAYGAEHNDHVVPSYNMQGVTGGPARPLDGWGPILDKLGLVHGNDQLHGHVFTCPETLDVHGLTSGQTGNDAQHLARGYMDWPAVQTLTTVYGKPLPDRGFNKVIRVAYWMNADNPLGIPRVFRQGIHFSGSVGYGPDPQGKVMQPNKFTEFSRPSELIALADGIYAGQQEATQLGQRNCRIGYRHPGGVGTANVVFADGHVDAIRGDRFPRKAGGTVTRAQARKENFGSFTVYTDPERFLTP